jgi:tetratricopeptide (TPR) repeat protein
VASALAFAHASGVVHRDVKPSNVFLCGGDIERAKLLDFGIAHLAAPDAQLTSTGVMLGTPAYMAPEQARGERSVGPAADVFSLGAVLYKCLTGRAPFVADDAFGMLVKLMSEEISPPSALRPSLPEELDRLVMRMLARSADERPQGGAAVLSELEALPPLDGLGAPPLHLRGAVLAKADRWMVCVVAVAVPEGAAAEFEGQVRSLAARNKGRVLARGEGRWALLLGEPAQDTTVGDGRSPVDRALSPTDLAVRAARCALGLRALSRGEARVAVASGRFARDAAAPDAFVDGAFDQMEADPSAPIRIDDVTASLLDARFDVTRDGGRLSLARERGDAEIGRTLLGKPTPCVGREQELVTLEAALSTCANEHVARAVLVLGAAGMGKSRLRAELLRRVRRQEPDVAVWLGGGDAIGHLSPFSMLGGALRRVLGLGASDDPVAARDGLAAALARRFSGAELGRMVEFLGPLVGAAAPEEPSVELRAARRDARLMADRTRLAWEDFVAASCAERPTLLVLEDVHWADAASVDLVDGALRRMQNGPFMVLALGRPEALEEFPGLFRSRDVQEIRLGPLSKRASERLVREVLGDRCSAEEVAALVERAGGNAFYLEELIRSVVEGSAAALPESVRAMIEARLATLDPTARRIVRAASVFGATFWRGGVRAILAGDVSEQAIDERLAELVRRELCARSPSSRFANEAEFKFRHALVRDAAYATLSEDDARLVHGLAADWLAAAGERRAGVVAEHFERGGMPERAVAGHLRAAEQALEGNDPLAAVRSAERAIACGAEDLTLGAALRVQAEAYNWHGSLAEAERAGLAAMRRLPRGSAAFYAAAREAAVAAGRALHVETLLALVPDLLCPAEPDGRETQIHAVALAVIQILFRSLFDQADELFAWLDGAAAALPDLDPKVSGPVAEARAWRALFSGDPALYLALSREAAAAYGSIGDVRNGARALLNTGYGAMQIGDFDEALRALREALAATERMGATALVVRHNLGLALAHEGLFDEAVATESAALAACDPANLRMIVGCNLYLALIHRMAGRLAEAERHAAIAADPSTPMGLCAYGLAVQAMVLLDLGRTEEALAAAHRGAAMLEELGRIDEGEAFIRLALAETLAAAGEREAARVAVAVAWARLRERADKIQDPRVRESFLKRVPENARTAFLAGEMASAEGAAPQKTS